MKMLNVQHKYTKQRNVLHPATGNPSDQVDAHTAWAPAPQYLIETQDAEYFLTMG
jgi:hypothetical protein